MKRLYESRAWKTRPLKVMLTPTVGISTRIPVAPVRVTVTPFLLKLCLTRVWFNRIWGMTGEPVTEAAPAFGAFLPVLGPPPWYPRPEEQMPASGQSQGWCVWVLGTLGLRRPSCPSPALSGVTTPGTPGPGVPSAFPEAPRSCSLRGGGHDLCTPVPSQPGQDWPVPLCRPRSPGFPLAHQHQWRWRGRCPWAGSGCSERGGSGQRPHRSGCAARCGGCRSVAGSRA